MTHQNGSSFDDDVPKTVEEAYDRTIRAIADLVSAMKQVTEGQRLVREEIQPITSSIEALTAQVRRVGNKVHRNSNVLTLLVNEAGELHQAKLALDRALDFFEGVQNAQKLAERKEERIETEKRLDILREAARAVSNDDDDETGA